MRYAVYILAMMTALSVAEEEKVNYKLDDDGKAIRLVADGKPVFQYNYNDVTHPDVQDTNFTRNGYLHPVWTPSGKIITDDWALKDNHAHQRGVWFAWTKTEIGGKPRDFWNLGKGEGKPFFAKFAEKSTDGFVAEHEWKIGNGGKNTQYTDVVLRERWMVRAAGRVENGFLFDLTTRQEALVPIHLPLYHYGGIAFRGASEWQPKTAPIKVVTSEGDDRVAGDKGVARWWHVQGKLGDGVAGFAIFDAPTNKNHPTPMRLNPDIPYFGFFPFKRKPFTIEPNQPIEFHYRMLVHDRELAPEKIESLWQNWSKSVTK